MLFTGSVKMKFRILNNEIRISALVVTGTIVFIAALLLFGWVADEIVLEKEDRLDMMAFNYFDFKSSPAILSVLRVVTFFGSIGFLVSAYVILLGYLIFVKRRKDALAIGIIAVISTIIIFGLKQIYSRQRPELPLATKATNYSFPSGHSLASLVFCVIIISLVWDSSLAKWLKILICLLFLGLTLLIGISRIALRLHFASDVVAGFSIGSACLVLYFWIRNRLGVSSPANR